LAAVAAVATITGCAQSSEADSGAVATPTPTEASIETAKPTEAADSIPQPSPTAVPPTPTPVVDSWENPQLLTPVSRLNVSGDTVLYEAIEPGTNRLVVVGVDAATGDELFRVPHYPLDRLGGMAGWVNLVEEDSNFIATERDIDGPFVAAHDPKTGQELWRSRGAGLIYRCSDDVCSLDRTTGTLTRYDGSTGEILSASDLHDTRIVAADREGALVVPGPWVEWTTDRRQATLIGLGNFGADERWRIKLGEVAPGEDFGLTANGGWHSAIYEGWVAQGLGSDADRSSFAVGAVVPSGAVFGYAMSSGDVGWVAPENLICLPTGNDLVILCEVEAFLKADDEGLDIRLRSIAGVEISTGSELWRKPIPNGTTTSEYTFRLSDEAVRVNGPGVNLHVDQFSGAPMPQDDRLELCTATDLEDITVTYNGRRKELVFSFRPLFAPCRVNGDAVSFANALQLEGELSPLLVVEAENGWLVGIENGTIAGHRISEDI